MRLRLFFTIGIALLLVVAAVNFIQWTWLSRARMASIDREVETAMALLLSSPLSSENLEEFEITESLVARSLGNRRLNLFVIISDEVGISLWRSQNSFAFPEEVDVDKRWNSLQNGGYFFRTLTLPIGSSLNFLTVGMVLNEDLLQLKTEGKDLAIYSLGIFVAVLLVTLFLVVLLMAPLRNVGELLENMALRLGVDVEVEKKRPNRLLIQDEVTVLLRAVKSLEVKLQKLKGSNALFVAQMAHEIKTPLTLLRNDLTRLDRAPDSERASLRVEMEAQIQHLADLVSTFLVWARWEGDPSIGGDIHAISLGALLSEMITGSLGAFRERLVLDVDSSNHMVFGDPAILRQMVLNLVENAAKYSPPGSPIWIGVRANQLSIEDQGPGIHPSVLAKLGQPFNRGQGSAPGFGLGLAWVSTVCKKFGWILRIESGSKGSGTKVIIEVPQE